MNAMAPDSAVSAEQLSFEADNVTGGMTVTATFSADLPAGAVATALAAKMSLPENVPWMLRSNTTSAFLDDRQPIGRQITPGERVTVTPKSHLG